MMDNQKLRDEIVAQIGVAIRAGTPTAAFHAADAVMTAIAAATGTAKTAKPVECEASQSGGTAASPDPRRIA